MRDSDRRPAELGDLMAEGIGLFCRCSRCGHDAVLDGAHMAAKTGPAVPVPSLAGRLRRGGCGAKDAAVRPAWPSLGRVARQD